MNYRVTCAPKVAACIGVLHKMMSNVLINPLEEKYRQVLRHDITSLVVVNQSVTESIGCLCNSKDSFDIVEAEQCMRMTGSCNVKDLCWCGGAGSWR